MPKRPPLVIHTAYEPRAGSNVGRYVARCMGRRRTVIDQSLRPDELHAAAATSLLNLLIDLTVVPDGVVCETYCSEDGQRRRFTVERPPRRRRPIDPDDGAPEHDCPGFGSDCAVCAPYVR